MLEKIKKYLYYGTLERREWLLVQNSIWKDNRFILETTSFSILFLMTVLAFYTEAFDDVYRGNAVSYGIISLLELFIFLAARFLCPRNLMLVPKLVFVFTFTMYFFGIALGTFLDTTSYALAFVVMIIVLPMLFCTRPIHSILSVLVVDVIFLLVSHSCKSSIVFYADLLNTIIWSTISFFLNAITNTARVRNHLAVIKNDEAQNDLRESFKRMESQMDMFRSLGSIYSTLYYVDLTTDSYIELVSLQKNGSMFGCSGGDASRRIQAFCGSFVATSFKEKILAFSDLKNIDEKLKNQNLVSMQFLSTFVQDPKNKVEWSEMILIAVKRDAASHVTSVLFATRNIHENKLREEEQMERLQRALQAAESTNKSKTAFLNNMSHDIRIPMNSIIGFTSLAQQNVENPGKVSDCLENISVANKHLLSLINDVLDMSRIDSGLVNLKEEPESILNIADELNIILQDDIASRKQTLEMDLSEVKNPYVFCDKLRVKQVLLNLLGNAVKFTPEGGRVILKISEQSSFQSGYTRFRMVVQNTGIGMSSDFLKKIFIPFEREMTCTIGGIQGTGLGLSIAKRLVDVMGGNISVESSLNEGTAFTVEISFRTSEESALVECTADGEARLKPNQLAGKRILLVEDNRMNQIIAKHMLNDSGASLVVAENGRIACEILDRYTPDYFDLVIMDIQMPEMDGYEATRRIRNSKDPVLSKIPIIALTADAFDENRDMALAAGMNDHVAKPVEAGKLYTALVRALCK